MKAQGVSIGDQFWKKSSYLATVIDIHTVTNSKGGWVRNECIAEYNFCGTNLRFETPFSTVVRNKFVKQ